MAKSNQVPPKTLIGDTRKGGKAIKELPGLVQQGDRRAETEPGGGHPRPFIV